MAAGELRFWALPCRVETTALSISWASIISIEILTRPLSTLIEQQPINGSVLKRGKSLMTELAKAQRCYPAYPMAANVKRFACTVEILSFVYSVQKLNIGTEAVRRVSNLNDVLRRLVNQVKPQHRS